MVRPNPWNPSKLAIVQCGERWGAGLPENHKYDLLPDYIVFTSDRDWDGSNTALCAGFFGADWALAASWTRAQEVAGNAAEPRDHPDPPTTDPVALPTP